MDAVLIGIGALLVSGLIAYYVAILAINNRRTPQEIGLTPILSLTCHVRSDPIVGFSSGKSFYSTFPARFSLYQDFIVLKSVTERVYRRDHVTFVIRSGWLRERLFIHLKELGDAIEISGETRRIIAALRTNGYALQDAQLD
jgi:hypothetical protein